MPDLQLSVTICSWNTRNDLRACLQSLVDCRDELSFEVVVVDNASDDDSADMVEKEFPQFRLIRCSENLGFTGGHNLALRERKAYHGMLLNSDTVVHPGALKELFYRLSENPRAAIVGPQLLNPDGSLQFSCRRFPNPLAAAFRNTILGKLFPNNAATRDYLMQDVPHDRLMKVDWVSGAAMLISGRFLRDHGALDPEFFMFCEDVDLCKRAWDAGYEVLYAPDAVITHAIGRSTDRVANEMIVRFHRSMFRYYCKHDLRRVPLLFRPILWLLALLSLSARAGAFLTKNKLDEWKRRWQSR